MFWQIGHPGCWLSLAASCQRAAARFLATGGSNVPGDPLAATSENNGSLFFRVAERRRTCARNNRFAGDKKMPFKILRQQGKM